MWPFMLLGFGATAWTYNPGGTKAAHTFFEPKVLTLFFVLWLRINSGISATCVIREIDHISMDY